MLSASPSPLRKRYCRGRLVRWQSQRRLTIVPNERNETDFFCEKIFGPEHDFQCSCGKYKGSQYQGIECSNCGVEITRSTVRRERMGHVDLAAPVAHYWYLRKVPSHVATLLKLPAQQVQNVVYFSSYYIKSVDEDMHAKN